MPVAIRNGISETCEGCFKKIIYEKDGDSGLDCLEVEGVWGNKVWMQLCEDCAEPYRERERRYLE
jgi:hypothetical protein